MPFAACAIVGPAVMTASEASLFWISAIAFYMCVTIVFGLRINKNLLFSGVSFYCEYAYFFLQKKALYFGHC